MIFTIRIFIFPQINPGTVVIYRLVFPVIGKPTSIDEIDSQLAYYCFLIISFCLLKMSSFKNLISDLRYLTLPLSNISLVIFQ